MKTVSQIPSNWLLFNDNFLCVRVILAFLSIKVSIYHCARGNLKQGLRRRCSVGNTKNEQDNWVLYPKLWVEVGGSRKLAVLKVRIWMLQLSPSRCKVEWPFQREMCATALQLHGQARGHFLCLHCKCGTELTVISFLWTGFSTLVWEICAVSRDTWPDGASAELTWRVGLYENVLMIPIWSWSQCSDICIFCNSGNGFHSAKAVKRSKIMFTFFNIYCLQFPAL